MKIATHRSVILQVSGRPCLGLWVLNRWLLRRSVTRHTHRGLILHVSEKPNFLPDTAVNRSPDRAPHVHTRPQEYPWDVSHSASHKAFWENGKNIGFKKMNSLNWGQ